MTAWQALYNLAKAGFATDAAYYHAQGLDPVTEQRDPNYPVYVDVSNLIDYMLGHPLRRRHGRADLQFPRQHQPQQLVRHPGSRRGVGFKFFVHDAEHTLSRANAIAGGDANRTGPFPAGWTDFLKSNPQMIHQELMANPDYRMLFADHAQKYLTHNGLMTAALATDPAGSASWPSPRSWATAWSTAGPWSPNRPAGAIPSASRRSPRTTGSMPSTPS